MSETL